MVKVLAVIVAMAALVPGRVKEIHRTLPLNRPGRVFLQTNRGTVEVAGWNRNAVEIYARIAPRTFLASQRACVSDTNIRVDAWPNSLRITPEYATINDQVPRLLAALFGHCTERPLVDYRVFVPRDTDLTIDGGEAKIRISGVAGRVRVRIAARKMGTWTAALTSSFRMREACAAAGSSIWPPRRDAWSSRSRCGGRSSRRARR